MTFLRIFVGYLGTVLAVTLTAGGLGVSIRRDEGVLEIAAWSVALSVAVLAGGAFYLRVRHQRRDV
jgi:hypothetical protein